MWAFHRFNLQGRDATYFTQIHETGSWWAGPYKLLPYVWREKVKCGICVDSLVTKGDFEICIGYFPTWTCTTFLNLVPSSFNALYMPMWLPLELVALKLPFCTELKASSSLEETPTCSFPLLVLRWLLIPCVGLLEEATAGWPYFLVCYTLKVT